MKAAAKTLVVFAKEDPGLLPRYQSNRSGKVFARITAKDNLEFFRNRSLPIESRLPDATRYLESLNTINKTYLGAFLKKSVGDSELIELVGATLRLPELLFELTEEFLPTLDKNDPTYKIRMDGVEKMKRGIALMAIGALQTLTENEVYRESELARLAESMKETFPKFVSRLPPASQKEALIRLKGLAEDPRRKYLQPAVRELYEATQASLPKQGPAK